MRWLLGVVMVCTGVARAEEAVKHRPSPVAVRLSLLLGGNFIISPPRVCPLCWPPVDPQQPYVELMMPRTVRSRMQSLSTSAWFFASVSACTRFPCCAAVR